MELPLRCRQTALVAGERGRVCLLAVDCSALLPISRCEHACAIAALDNGILRAGTRVAPPSTAKAARYNLRQRSKLKVPPRFAGSDSAAADSVIAELTNSAASAPSLPNSNHTLDLTRLIPPSAVLRQPRSEVHVDDMVNQGWVVDNAIFSHAWSPDGCAMFSCGGPLAMGVRGCYMALWC